MDDNKGKGNGKVGVREEKGREKWKRTENRRNSRKERKGTVKRRGREGRKHGKGWRLFGT